MDARGLTELARALVSEPRVLLADEPASGLSATQRSVLAQALTAISADRAVVVEHDLDMLTAISGHMWAMVEGRLAYSGDVETFRSSPCTRACAAYSKAELPEPSWRLLPGDSSTAINIHCSITYALTINHANLGE